MTTTLITGATRGVGLELARRLTGAGHDVRVGARDLDRGREVAASIGARAVQIDVTHAASVRAAVDHLRDEVGLLDVLINNAGISGAQQPPASGERVPACDQTSTRAPRIAISAYACLSSPSTAAGSPKMSMTADLNQSRNATPNFEVGRGMPERRTARELACSIALDGAGTATVPS